MATNKPRINITVEPDMMHLLEELAQQKQQPVADLCRDFLKSGLALIEDQVLSQIADARDSEITPDKLVDHDTFWQQFDVQD